MKPPGKHQPEPKIEPAQPKIRSSGEGSPLSGPVGVSPWLVSGGPGLGELVGGEAAVGAVGSVHVVVDAPVFDEDLGFDEVVELPAVEEFVA